MKLKILACVFAWLAVDYLFFTAVKTVTDNYLIYTAYWLFEVVLIGMAVFGMMQKKTGLVARLITILLLTFISKLFTGVLLLTIDIVRQFAGFESRSILITGSMIVFSLAFVLILMIVLRQSRHHYKIHKTTISFADLPEAFNGFTITQLSDIHAGSFTSKKGVQKGVNLVNAQNSDVIVFTGDLVNNSAAEMEPWIDTFAQLNAPYGMFSILGNHDYGDYIAWESPAVKEQNLIRLKEIHQEIGFQLLLNESVEIQKEDASVGLIGVENWGKGNFHRYGDLNKAIESVLQQPFKILLSHDPSHWDAVVTDYQPLIHLTLSGHTHGMQFGFEFMGIKWSPSKYIYQRWAGLYESYGRYLYVNRGFGFLGLKGRLGVWAEISVITLKRG
ncbi:metallophosphoesterase [Paenimyroides baculatum]|uniref:Metallophosphoesterase n=1 Tax=Paenimyroides baculatum TaxID=2608000 RepID=A0A5M6CRL5_9FLAO|nr:metallophosphoesterase [Paenimyroides baculatum]KAA5537824.1 metallophosphoesterase [Paenimyroides baculatum]